MKISALKPIKVLWKPYGLRCGGSYHVETKLVLADICSGPNSERAYDNLTRYHSFLDVGRGLSSFFPARYPHHCAQ